ncbi:MAG TPA: ABC transporter permease, partial [Candidatus Acidoferrum sp.]|nr:ABC transporter permease [Candidatus Acidoferrum sp.]
MWLRRLLALYADSLRVPLGAPLHHAALLRMLAQRELAARTSGTLLGRLWPLLQPALQVFGFWFMFAVIFDMRNQRADYLQYLLLGMLPWLCFSEVLTRSTGLFREFSSLFARTPFPLEVLPSVVLVIPATVYTAVLVLTSLWLLGPVAAFKALWVVPLLLLWALPLMLLCAVTGLFVRDFGQVLPFLLMLLMYLTPIMYFPDMVPAQVRDWLWLNPMADWMTLVHAVIAGTAIPVAALWRLG